MEKLLGVEFVTKRTTDEGLTELDVNPGKYAFVITDMSRPNDRRAGYTLLEGMRARNIDTPVVIYTAASSRDTTGRPCGAAPSGRRTAELP